MKDESFKIREMPRQRSQELQSLKNSPSVHHLGTPKVHLLGNLVGTPEAHQKLVRSPKTHHNLDEGQRKHQKLVGSQEKHQIDQP